MSRLAVPPAQVPTLTDIVPAPSLPSRPESFLTPVIALPQGLQRDIASRVVRRIDKSLKAQLRKFCQQQPGGISRTRLVAFLRDGVEQAVGDAVDQALARHVQRTAVASVQKQGQSATTKLGIPDTKVNGKSG